MQKATAFMLVAVIIAMVVRFLRGGDEWDNDGRFRWVDSLVDRNNIVWILVWREQDFWDTFGKTLRDTLKKNAIVDKNVVIVLQ